MTVLDRTAVAVVTDPLLPPRATSDGTLRRIHEAALRCFGQTGYHGVSVRDLAEASGIRSSSLYAHVRSKEQLLFDLVLLAHEEHRDTVREAVLAAGSDPVEQLRAYVRAHVTMHATYPLLARVANRELAALAPANERTVRAVRDDAVLLMETVLERGQEAGVFHAAEPFLTAAAIGAMGIRVAEWWDPTSGYAAAQVAEYFADLAVKMAT